MNTFEETAAAIRAWLEGLAPTVDAVNARFDDGNNIKMPRSKDLIVTFPEDASAQPEQMPMMVLEIEMAQWQSIAPAKGVMSASLYLADEAKSGAQARTKLMRWTDAIRSYCMSGSSVMHSGIRVMPRRESYVMGKAKGDLNAFQVKYDLAISF